MHNTDPKFRNDIDNQEIGNTSKTSNNKQNSRFLRRFLMIIGWLFASGLSLVVGLFWYYSQDLPDFSSLKHYHPPAVTRIYSSDGKLLEEYAKEHRVFVPISTIPKSLIEAFIAAEDRNFYDHPGIDIVSIFRAAIANVGNFINHRRMEGGSTLTQQVVKNFLLTSERSLPRKIKEAILSYMISKAMTKEQILELYLNQMYLGKGAYGVAAAATAYFNKSVDELSVPESAFLASLPKAPSSINPERHYERSLARRNYVISRMEEDGYITKEVALEAKKTPIKLVKRDKTETVTADYYAEHVREEIVRLFGQEKFYTGGLTVITSMNTKYQKQAEISLRKGLREYDRLRGYRGPVTKIDIKNWQNSLKSLPHPEGLLEYQTAVILSVEDSYATIGLADGKKSNIPIKEMTWGATNLKSAKKILNSGDVVVVEPSHNGSYALRQIPKVNGAFMAMEPNTGRVLAMVGGYDFSVSKFNRATQAIRQPGSTIKPIVYLAALENNIKPNTIFEDAPVEMSQGPGMPVWRPKNYNRDFFGPITMRTGLEKSRNLVTVRVMQKTGIDKVAEIINRFGIMDNPPHYFSMGLGAVDTTVERMLTAYAVVDNGGTKVKPQYIEIIKDADGKVLYRRNGGTCHGCNDIDNVPVIENPVATRLTDPASDYQLISLMEGSVIRGTSVRVKKLDKIMACKTGTTNNSMDTWFIGMTPILATATYVGYDTPKSLGKRAVGGTVALPIFYDFMANAYKNEPSLPYRVPDSIIEMKIDKTTGKPYDGPGAIVEAFKKEIDHNDNHKHSDDLNDITSEHENEAGIY